MASDATTCTDLPCADSICGVGLIRTIHQKRVTQWNVPLPLMFHVTCAQHGEDVAAKGEQPMADGVSCSRGLLVNLDSRALALRRAWCLFEVWTALQVRPAFSPYV